MAKEKTVPKKSEQTNEALAQAAKTSAQEATPQTATADKSAPAPTLAGVFGETVWLMSESRVHRHMFIADLEWYAMPALLLAQYRIFRVDGRPVGIALWAMLGEEAEARLLAGETRLKPDDWRSGDRLWLVDVLAPFGRAEDMLKELKTSVFKGKSFHYQRTKPDGQRETITDMGEAADD